MHDYSAYTATMPARIAKLSDELSRKRWQKALHIAYGLLRDLMRVIIWIRSN